MRVGGVKNWAVSALVATHEGAPTECVLEPRLSGEMGLQRRLIAKTGDTAAGRWPRWEGPSG